MVMKCILIIVSPILISLIVVSFLRSNSGALSSTCGERIDDFSTTERLRNLERLFEWIRSNGGFISDSITPFVKSELYDDIGLQANEDFEIEDILGTVPVNLLLFMPTILEDPYLGKSIKRLNLDDRKYQNHMIALTIFVLYHKYVLGENSFFHPYLQIMTSNVPYPWLNPLNRTLELLKRFNSFTSFYFEQKIDGLKKFTRMVENTIQSDELLFKKFDYLRDKLGENGFRELVGRTILIIQSRVFFLGDKYVLIPFWDSFNTNIEGKNHLQKFILKDDVKVGKVIVCSLSFSLNRGEEIFVEYEPNVENIRLLFTYGFIFEENPNDGVTYSYDINMKNMLTISYSFLKSNWDSIPREKRLELLENLNNHEPFFGKMEELIKEGKIESDPVTQYIMYEKRQIQKCKELLEDSI